MLKEYREYLADNPEGYWFKRKMYGYGWTPAKWQGWALTIAYVALIFGVFFFSSPEQGLLDGEQVVWAVILATALYMVIVWRTGESPKWQWGNKQSDESK